MTDKMMGVILGGLLPALCFGASSVLMKLAARAGVGLGPYVLSLAVGVGLYGGFTLLTQGGCVMTSRGVLFAVLVGLTWAVGMAFIQIALTRYGGQRTPASRKQPKSPQAPRVRPRESSGM